MIQVTTHIYQQWNRLNVKNSGQAILTSIVFFSVISTIVLLGIAAPIVREAKITNDFGKSRTSLYLAEGATEDALYRLKNGFPLVTGDQLVLDNSTASLSVSNTAMGKKIIASANTAGKVRKIQSSVVLGTGVAFHFGVQSGNGGFILNNTSKIIGNVFASGPVLGSGNVITGDVISAGATGTIIGPSISGSAYAHTIGGADKSTTVGKDAYYQSLINTTVAGVKYPGSIDQAPADLPIPDSLIEQWESDAVAGGVLASSFCDTYTSSTNTCTISTNKTLGPKKIPFNLELKSSGNVLTVTGPLWITGNITTQTSPKIKMATALGSTNVAIIADDPTNRSTGSTINIGQNTVFEGSGSPGSFVFMISQNNSAEKGGSTVAISMGQGSSALVGYASHGLVELSQSVNLKQVTAYLLRLGNSATVTYDTGLPSTLFAAGPSGGYSISEWKETQ